MAVGLAPGVIAKISAEAGVQALVADALQALPVLIPTLPAEAVIYCDPPYLLSTRQNRVYYDHELSGEQHALLLTLRSYSAGSGVEGPRNAAQSPGWPCKLARTLKQLTSLTPAWPASLCPPRKNCSRTKT